MHASRQRAPLRARTLATGIDAATAGAGAVALAYATGARRAHRLWPSDWWRPADGARSKRAFDDLTAVLDERGRTPLMRAVLFALEVQGERGETPGARRAGIVRVNVHRRQRVGLAEGIVRAGLPHAATSITHRLTNRQRGRAQDWSRRTQQLAPQVDELRRAHAGDPPAEAARAVASFYEEHGVDSAGCLSGWLRMVAVGQLVSLSTRRGRRRLLGPTVYVRR